MKIAGMFEYPPVMYTQIEEWMNAIWCSHVAASLGMHDNKTEVIQKALSKFRKDLEETFQWIHPQQEMEASKTLRVPRWSFKGLQYSNLKIQTATVLFNPENGNAVVPWKNRDPLHQSVFSLEGSDSRVGGSLLGFKSMNKDPTGIQAVKEELDYVSKEAIDDLKFQLSFDNNDITLSKEVQEIQQAVKPFLKGPPKRYLAKSSRSFPLNLTGWKYANRGSTPSRNIQVILDFKGHSLRGGQWDKITWELQVDMPKSLPRDLSDLKRQIARNSHVLIHELRHVAQTVLSDMVQRPAGIPSPNIPGYNHSGVSEDWRKPRQEHALRPVEFYPRLGDEVAEFLGRYPDGGDAPDIDYWTRNREFFKALRAHKPLDWRKAVSLFMNQVQQAKSDLRTKRVASRWVAAEYKRKKNVKVNGKNTVVYEYSDRQVARRHNEKAKRLESFKDNLGKLRAKVKRDLTSKDAKVSGIALAVALVDHTYERIGNPNSADDGHFGVTGWQGKHLTFKDGEAVLQYVGKSGVSHRKTIGIKWLVDEIKKATKGRKDSDTIVHNGEGAISASDVNAYLADFEITAKDLRGFHANTLMQRELRKVREGKLPDDKKEREALLKEEFTKALDTVAKQVGHTSGMLKGQYLVPGLEDQFLKDGTVMDDFTDV